MTNAFGKVPNDLQVQSIEFNNATSSCNGIVRAKRVDACTINAKTISTDTISTDTLITNNLIVPTCTVGLSRLAYFPEPETFQFLIEPMNGVTAVQWNIQQFWIQTGDRNQPFVPLLPLVPTPIFSSTFLTASQINPFPLLFIPTPGAPVGGIQQFLDFLNQVFSTLALDTQYGLRALPAVATATSNATFSIQSSLSKIVNFVFILGRFQTGGSNSIYAYALDMGIPFKNASGFANPYNGMVGWATGVTDYAGQNQPQDAIDGQINLLYHNTIPQLFMTSSCADPFTFETLLV